MVNTTLKVAKGLVYKKKYTGMLVCGDFNYHQIKWTIYGDVGVTSSHNSLPSLFLDNLYDLYLTQSVEDPTFQTTDGI